jgi:hypothetical protein
MKSTLIVAVVCSTLVGCASTRQLSPEAGQKLPGKSVTQIKYAKPDFVATTPAKAMFGLLGFAAMVAAGNEIVEKNKVEDPAPSIALELTKQLKEKYQLIPLNETAVQVKGSDVDKLAQQHPQSDLIMEVRTTNWQMLYYPTGWASFRVAYNASARLMDLKSKDVLAEGHCEYLPDNEANAPSYDAMIADDARRLKEELRMAADFCMRKFKAEMFKM